MVNVKVIDAATLNQWLESGKDVCVVDIRTPEERKEWYIPGSYHFDAYDKLKQQDPNALDKLRVDKKVPVITVCGGGKTSLLAAQILQEKGYEVYSLKDGMKGWSLAWNKAILNKKDYKIFQLRRTGKGCLSYIITAEGGAIIIDASLPIEVYENLIKQNNLRLISVMETHIHADHLSRSKQIADKFHVPLMLPVPNKIQFNFQELHGDDIIHLGKLSLKVIATPGHTMESVCFLLNNEVLFSGDTIFTGAVGRPDLKANAQEAKHRAGLLYDSLQKLIHLGEEVIVLPAHSSHPVDFNNIPIQATLSEIKRSVAVLHLNKEAFVNAIIGKLPPPPPNYLTIVEKNLAGDFSDINPIDLEAGANHCAIS
jgi:glyoxylase-like metal-dependent hydrolase (beta-lactamase superfamily II)/rhodanese-related sulfurtransferase